MVLFSSWLFLSAATPAFGGATLGVRDFRAPSASALQSLAEHPDPVRHLDSTNPVSHLSKILIPRAPGTENNTRVREYIVSTLKALDWHIEFDSFRADTPVGPRNFTNVVATKDIDAPRRLVLAAHYDSKYFASFPENQFVGATDSAAPCALMLDLAQALDPLLSARATRLDADELAPEEDEDVAGTTLQLVFFDGEEAFRDWTDTDSIYGARHLAAEWASTALPPHPKRRFLRPGTPTTPLALVEHFVLLDLLGAQNPRVKSYFPETGWLFDAMIAAEARLLKDGLIGTEGGTYDSFFRARKPGEAPLGYMGDDHVPFLQRGVSVLHVITEPFPRQWHTLADDASALHLPTLRRWNLVFRLFLVQYLELRPEDAALARRVPMDDGDGLGAESLEMTHNEHSSFARAQSDLVV